MATLRSELLFSSTSSAPTPCLRRRRIQATLQAPISPRNTGVSLPQIPDMTINVEKLILKRDDGKNNNCILPQNNTSNAVDKALTAKLYAIAEAVADRAVMHGIIAEQRNDWNKLLLSSINSITLSASLMAGISSMALEHSTPLSLSSTLLFGAATAMMILVNKIQPSQLAEEQRKATQLFEALDRSIQTTIALGSPTELDVKEAMEKMLAIDRAYPLPLLPLLEKFPKKVEPAKWWPKLKSRRQQQVKNRTKNYNNGWSEEIEQEMKGILRVLKAKDEEQYIECGELILKINKALSISGPVLAGLAATGAGSMIGSSPDHGQWPAIFAVAGGALATVVNTLEHGGQMGMVFELFRNCAGYYRQLEEEIERNLGERDVENREDAELFQMKLALQLGRSLSEMKDLASYADSSSCKEDDDIKEFAGKLF